jgi:hypothetical protein
MRNIFVSFHQRDELEASVFCRRFDQYFNQIRTLGAHELGDEYAERIKSGDSDYVMRQIREKKIAGTSCTVVLIGKCTWARRYIDWEIAATLRNNADDPRGGLIAVQLPSAQQYGWSTLPDRLSMNISSIDGVDTGYARYYSPAPSDDSIARWVEDAVARRDSMEPSTGSTSNLVTRNKACDRETHSSLLVDMDRRAIRADERDVDAESHCVGDVGQLAEREVATAGFDGGDIGRRDSEALSDLGLSQSERLAGVFDLAADDLRVDLGYRGLRHEAQAAVK